MSTKEIKSLCNGKVIVVMPDNLSEIVPLFCPICCFPMKTIDDSVSYRKFGTCAHCDNRWTNDKMVDWAAGKLPDKDSEGWAEYLVIRTISAIPKITLK